MITTQPGAGDQSLMILYVDPSTYELWQRPASLFACPKAISFKDSEKAFHLVYHLRDAITYLLLKRGYDAKSENEKQAFKFRFLYLRELAISLFGEEELRKSAKQLKLDKNVTLCASSDEVSTNSEERLTLLEVPSRVIEQNTPQPPTTLPTLTAERAPYRVPLASPEAVNSCLSLIAEMVEEVRKSYLYNGPRLLALSDQLSSGSALSEEQLSAAITLASGPLNWLRNTRAELYLKINTLESALESSAVLGALGDTEKASKLVLSHWQNALGQWQKEVDRFFPRLNADEASASGGPNPEHTSLPNETKKVEV